MKISFLKAHYGDSIHIEHKGHHVIIDGGPLCDELNAIIKDIIDKQEVIDLLVITHYDEDHILGIYKILKELSCSVSLKDVVKAVWFNATKLGLNGNNHYLSSQQAVGMAELLVKNDINWISLLKKRTKYNIDDTVWIEVLYGGDVYTPQSEGQFLSSARCDWMTSFKELEPFINDDVPDDSPTNSQSIILVLHDGERQILLSGDATPGKLYDALRQYINDGNSNHFDLIKLPHHGSYRNITKEILNLVVCNDYIISTDGNRFFHPDKKMFMKICSWGQRDKDGKIMFHMNYYDELFPLLNITDTEMSTYKFECDGRRIF